ncbi:MAG: DUF2157 domain-containing protein [Flavobacteriaceae bacterium]|nr:DUF2157 domain-containing protein [Flavobacteriaceae bacterium]
MSILNDLQELESAGVISKDTSTRIESYYKSKKDPSTNKLFVVFGILGAILVGLGIILIIAHNWDELSRGLKTGTAFLPLLVGQALCSFTLLKKHQNIAWKEGSAVFLFFAVGASTALISQIYNIPGDLSSYLLTWMILILPLVYVMRSSMVSLLYIIGTTYFASETGYWDYPIGIPYVFWPMIAAIVPHYYLLLKKSPNSNFVRFHNWFIALSLTVVLGTFSNQMDELMFLAYTSLFGLFHLFGTSKFLSKGTSKNGYTLLGSMGTVIILLILSFNEFWEHLIKKEMFLSEIIVAPEFIITIILSVLDMVFLYERFKSSSIKRISPFSVAFLVFIPIFIIGTFSSIAVFLINFLVLAIGILTIRDGSNRNHLGILNFGLLIVAALIVCRFFDTDLSFVIRGLLFVLVGVGFFFANYKMIRKRQGNEW